MRLEKAAAFIKKSFDQIEFEETVGEDSLELCAHIVAEEYYDDDIFCRIALNADGTLHVFFTFDKLDASIQAYELLNDFNSNNSWFSAYIEPIEDCTYLQLHFSSICAAIEKDIADTACFAIVRLLDDDISKLIKPLSELTYSD